DRDDQVAGAKPGRRRRPVGDELADLDAPRAAELAREPRRERTLLSTDPEVRAPEPSLRHQRADDPPRDAVDRNGEAEPDAGDGGVDPDHPRAAVGERAA